jgi:hypothetical protein
VADIPSSEEIRAIVTEAVAPLRAEVARLRSLLEDETVSLEEAARKRGCSVRSLQRQVKAGDLPAVKGGPSGRGLRVRLADVLPANDTGLAHRGRGG